MPWLRWLVTGLTMKQPGFHPRPVHVKYVANEVAMKQAFLWLLQFSLVRIIHQCSIPVIYILFLLEGQMGKPGIKKKKSDAPSQIRVCCIQFLFLFILHPLNRFTLFLASHSTWRRRFDTGRLGEICGGRIGTVLSPRTSVFLSSFHQYHTHHLNTMVIRTIGRGTFKVMIFRISGCTGQKSIFTLSLIIKGWKRLMSLTLRKLYTGVIVSGLQAFSKIITFMVAQNKKLLTCEVYDVPQNAIYVCSKCNITLHYTRSDKIEL